MAERESVWDYPRPPRVEPCRRRVRVIHNGTVVADSTRALRVLETSSPPTIYVPPGDVALDHLSETATTTSCEWKGLARHRDVVVDGRAAPDAAWTYSDPKPGYEELSGYIAFYASRVDECWMDEERVTPQPGSYYGGWITSDIEGPFKGEPGSEGW
jgi:uncharacterized protein (DUF427 family)